jgi:hypothetical protein
MDSASRQRFYKEPGLISISAKPIGGKAAILIVDFWVLGLWQPRAPDGTTGGLERTPSLNILRGRLAGLRRRFRTMH